MTWICCAALSTVAAQANPADIRAADILAINAGGPGFSNWESDIDSPNYVLRTRALVTTVAVEHPAPQRVYETQRFFDGKLVYSLAGLRPDTTYTVRLHFAELVANQRGQRVFDVSVNHHRMFKNLDVFGAAGGKFRALIERFQASADPTGKMELALTPVRGNPIISGIEVQRR